MTRRMEDAEEWLYQWEEMLSCKPNSAPWKRRDAAQQRLWNRLDTTAKNLLAKFLRGDISETQLKRQLRA